ncbi:MAG: hypothetical protein LBL07_08575 [Tannerella sp.]|jgi:hypothetical protein|nr:hypothetical protein [Tannerella sp.]
MRTLHYFSHGRSAGRVLALALLAHLFIGTVIPQEAFAAAGDVTAKTIGVNCPAGNGILANAGGGSIAFQGTWPDDSYVAISYGLVLEGTALNYATLSSAFIYLGDGPGQGTTVYKYFSFDLATVSPAIPAGQYRVVVFADGGGGEEVFYSDTPVEVIEGDGYAYHLSATTLEVTSGGEVGDTDGTTLTAVRFIGQPFFLIIRSFPFRNIPDKSPPSPSLPYPGHLFL